MNLNDPIPERDAAGLRSFGIVTGSLFVLVFGLFFPWLLEARWPLWPWVIAGVLTGWALIHPASLNPVYRGWMRFGMVLGWFTSKIVLGVLFYLVFTPFGVVMRLAGWDPLSRKLDPGCESYRKASKARNIKHMEKPF